METKIKETIPLWLAVAITVVVSLPFGLWLDNIGGNLNRRRVWCAAENVVECGAAAATAAGRVFSRLDQLSEPKRTSTPD